MTIDTILNGTQALTTHVGAGVGVVGGTLVASVASEKFDNLLYKDTDRSAAIVMATAMGAATLGPYMLGGSAGSYLSDPLTAGGFAVGAVASAVTGAALGEIIADRGGYEISAKQIWNPLKYGAMTGVALYGALQIATHLAR